MTAGRGEEDSIVVIGAGYVGLTAAVAFAHFGFNVTCVERDQTRRKALKSGRVPFHEACLPEEMRRRMAQGRLSFTDDDGCVAKTRAVFLAVGTPTVDGRSDLSQVFEATRSLGEKFPGGIVVNKSTVPPGSAARIEAILAEGSRGDVEVVSNPEFLREGTAWHDFLHPDRIVIGCRSDRAEGMMRRIYRTLIARDVPFLRTSHRSAEIIKQASNAYLATRLGFLHQICDLCERAGADIVDVARGLGMDRRIGQAFLRPGPGYGGGCLPKDVGSLIGEFEKRQIDPTILKAVADANRQRRASLAERIFSLVPDRPLLAILGLTFKARTSDLRESPALAIAHRLAERGARLRLHDPGAEHREILESGLTDPWFRDPYAAAQGVDGIVVLTEWEVFADLDWGKIARKTRGTLVFDARNICDGAAVVQAGLNYHRLGRENPAPPERRKRRA